MKCNPQNDCIPKARRQPTPDLNYELVRRAELLTLTELDRPARQVTALAGALGVTERTLRKAFKRTHNLSPCRHLRILRLTAARRALVAARYEFATVTEIATSFGFVELGRFAVEYRNAFGESPSATLRRQPAPGAGSDGYLPVRRRGILQSTGCEAN